jgi:hypothetical protein
MEMVHIVLILMILSHSMYIVKFTLDLCAETLPFQDVGVSSA